MTLRLPLLLLLSTTPLLAGDPTIFCESSRPQGPGRPNLGIAVMHPRDGRVREFMFDGLNRITQNHSEKWKDGSADR